MIQIFPGLPKTIAEAVKFWSYGTSDSHGIALRLLRSAKSRKNLISEYSDHKWRKSGLRSALQRMQKLMEAVAVFSKSRISSIDGCGIDKDWNMAISEFVM